VPTIVARCIPVRGLCRFDPAATPTLPGSSCVLGTLAVWLRDVHVPESFDDPDRFVADPRYAFHLANFDLLTKLIDHDDAKANNFLAANDESNPQFFAVDIGISFGDLRHTYITGNWDGPRVPALKKRSVDRLHRVNCTELDALAVLVELRAERYANFFSTFVDTSNTLASPASFGQGSLRESSARSKPRESWLA
jgi:hypothetical protein